MADYTQKNRGHDQLKTRKKKKNKGLIALLIVLLILAVGLGAVALYIGRLYSLSNYVSDSQVAKALSERMASGAEDVLSASVSGEGSGSQTLPANKDIYNLLLVGVDRRDDSWAGNSDSMILVSINNKKKQVHMISFMRDLYADIPGYGVNKLNAACAHGGCPLLVETIEQNYGVNIDNYASVDFVGLAHIIDAFGGVQLELSDEEAEWANAYILDVCDIAGEDPEPHLFNNGGGTYMCDGYQAVAYSRLRYVGNNDYERTQRQRSVISALLTSAKSMNIAKLSDIAVKILPEVTHNIGASQLVNLILMVPNVLKYEMSQERIPYDGLYTSENEILMPDMEETRKRLNETIYG
ncbi:MAG: LCP family protein [Lachnospiraceae bacterium]|nr:LCP family protein [Lachnospiraceae bacterium]